MRKRGIPLLDDSDTRALVRQKFKQAGMDLDVLEELVEIELEHMGMGRRHGINDAIREVLDRAAGE